MVSGGGVAEVLLERDAELDRLSVLLDRARIGSGATVVIEGAAGIGKTDLLAAVHQLAAERGFRSLKARGREREAEMAFGVVAQLLEPPVLTATARESRRLLAGPARTGAGALGLAEGTAPESESAALHGLYWLCVNLARSSTPLLVSVDDLQWADGPSLAWLGYFGLRVGELPILLITTVRNGDPRAGEPAISGVVDDPAAHHISLTPLSLASVTALVHRQLHQRAGAGFCRACAELAGGNPLHVRELLAAARSEQLTGDDSDAARLRELAPTAIGALVQSRLARLRPDAVALAEALAVLGSQHEVAVAAELAGVDPAAAELAADELATAQIIAPARPLDFVHPLIGEAVYANVGLGARRLAHRRAATVLDRAGALDRVAAHLLATGPSGDPWVVDRLGMAAANARGRGAPEVAASYLRRALAEPPADIDRAGLILRLGNAEWYAGQAAAITHLEEALAEGRNSSTVAAAAGTLANAYLVLDRIDAAVAVLQQASTRIGVANPRRAASLEASAALAGILDDRTAPRSLAMVDRFRAELDGVPDPPVRYLVAIAQVAMRRNQPDEAAHLAERALARQPYPPPVDASTSTIVSLIGIEDFEGAQRLCEDTMASARQRAALPGLAAIASFSAWAMLNCGELADAEAQVRWALDRATGIFAMDAVAHLVEILVERGELDVAEAELGRIPAPLDSHSIMAVTFLMARGRLRAIQERHAEALRDFLLAGQRCESLGIVMAMYNWRSQAAIMQWCLERTDAARELARAEIEITRAAGRPRALGIALRASGLIENGKAGLDLLAESIRVLETSPARVELARALADYGAALRRAGQRAQARTVLEQALDAAHHCGARQIAAQARDELVAAGAKPRREAITGRDALTASELRVARLAAAGRTNREIAQSLFITAKTASAHLTRVYRKLGVTRRNQLAQALNSSIS